MPLLARALGPTASSRAASGSRKHRPALITLTYWLGLFIPLFLEGFEVAPKNL